jgi:hypothetical protein
VYNKRILNIVTNNSYNYILVNTGKTPFFMSNRNFEKYNIQEYSKKCQYECNYFFVLFMNCQIF